MERSTATGRGGPRISG